MKKAIIIANGDIPSLSNINYLKKNGYNKIICADGGANHARRLKIIPDLIIGDLDSISKSNLNYYRSRCEIIRHKRQNDTDVEKALKYLIKKKYSETVLLGATGNRLDHTICNLGIVLKFFSKIKISILYKNSFLKPITGSIKLPTCVGEIISLYGFDANTIITAEGLKYPLVKSVLAFGEKESTSNVAEKETLKLNVTGGIVFIIRNFKVIRKYDFI